MKRYAIGLIGLLLLTLSGCDAIAADRARAEAERAAARAAEVRAVYDGKATVLEAKAAEALAKQHAWEETLEANQAAATQAFLQRQLELDLQAARRASDLRMLALVAVPLGLPLMGGGVAAFLFWRRRQQQQRMMMVYHQIAQLQRRGLLRPGLTVLDVDNLVSGRMPWEVYCVLPEGKNDNT